MRGFLLIAAATMACQPKQPVEPSYFTQQKPANAPADCSETLACYDACVPLVEECMLRCDERSSYYPVQRARDVANCVAQAGCSPDDRECRGERCGTQVQACEHPGAIAPGTSSQPSSPGTEPMPPQPVRE